ncbi:MAG: DUF3187 family protein [Planctomycetes bacterium]|nr:DUF3187 family protein [Planctomycetota bacterium]
MATVAGGLAGCVATPRFAGPLPVRNQHPAQLTVLHLPPARATVLPAEAADIRLDAAYSSLFLNGTGFARSYYMDGEYLRFGPTLRAGLGSDLELSVGLPFAHASGGFLDAFLIDYHDVLGLPDQNRDSVENGDFRVDATRNGNTVWRLEPGGVELADVPLSLTWQLRELDDGPALALRGGLELPTGDDDKGYGNGELDWGVGGLLEQRWAGMAFYCHAQHTFAGTPAIARRGGLSFADVTSLGATAELPLFEQLNALVQVEWETSTLRHLGLEVTDREQVLLWVGGRYHFAERAALEFGFGEDLVGYVSPDFTAWIGLTTITW